MGDELGTMLNITNTTGPVLQCKELPASGMFIGVGMGVFGSIGINVGRAWPTPFPMPLDIGDTAEPADCTTLRIGSQKTSKRQACSSCQRSCGHQSHTSHDCGLLGCASSRFSR